MKREIILKGNKCVLRSYKKDDIDPMAKIANNKAIAKNMYSGWPNPYTKKDAKLWVERNLKEQTIIKFPLKLAIEVNGVFAGGIGGSIKENSNNSAMSFGYWLDEKFWGKGIITEAIELFIEYIFKNTKICRISATVYPWNEGSKKVLEKTGFKLEGIMRRSYFKNGKMTDEYLYSKLKND
ncbi:MAG: GNAT family protein [Candidatus Paceibacterota bacterium]|jgi:RimJ/RimL family protein N-acetyltransferase